MGTRPSRLETNHFYPTRKTRFECQMSLNYFIGLVNCACEESSSLFQTSVFMVIKLAQRVAWRYRVFVLFFALISCHLLPLLSFSYTCFHSNFLSAEIKLQNYCVFS